ncbi:unnamed protein product [Ascophyllum nodosum]
MIQRGLLRMGLRAGGSGCCCNSIVGATTAKRHLQHQQENQHLRHHQQQTRGFKGLAAVIIGAPGSGKGTISGKILRDFDFAHVSTGDLLRDEVQAGSEVGRKAKTFMDQGKFVPDAIILELLLAAVEQAKSRAKHIMLDGFPRSKTQAITLKEHLQVDLVMNLDVPRDVIVERLTDRWIHPGSGRVYAYSYRPPKEEGKDDATGETLVRRDDDQPEVVEQRLAKYEKTTRPLLDFYDAEGILHCFCGDKSDVIYEDVKVFLGETLPDQECSK